MKKWIITLLLLCINYSLLSAGEIPVLKAADLPGLDIKTQNYDGESLWGYIDGGADLYLEYGFEQLVLQKIKFNGEEIKVEIFRMKDDTSAYGIYSVSHAKCDDNKSLQTKFYCTNKYHIQMTIGRDYISIINESGSDNTFDFCTKLADIIIEKSMEKDFHIPYVLVNSLSFGNLDKLKLAKGSLGIQNGLANISSLFKFEKAGKLYYLPVTYKNQDVDLLYIEFENLKNIYDFSIANKIYYNETNEVSTPLPASCNYFVKLSDTSLLIIHQDMSMKGCSEIYQKYFK